MKAESLRDALDQSAPAFAERTVTLLGATGSIGASTIDLLKRERARFRVEAVTANTNAVALAALARELGARFAAVGDPAAYDDLKDCAVGDRNCGRCRRSGLIEAAQRPAEWVIGAITGAAGLKPTLGGGRARRDRRARQQGNAGLRRRSVHAPGGGGRRHRAAGRFRAQRTVPGHERQPTRGCAPRDPHGLRRPVPHRERRGDRGATVEQALKHPNWSMGAKVTVDSATLMNKGLELIEAHHLFALPSEQIDVLVHPQSIVHSLVEFCDGSMIAQLGSPDMRIPIAYCLAWPERRLKGPAPRLDLARAATLTFEEPDIARFPALGLARRALEAGGAAPTVLNAANEVAVAEFLARRLEFCRHIGTGRGHARGCPVPKLDGGTRKRRGSTFC